MISVKSMEPTVRNIVRIYMTKVGGPQISLRRFVAEMNKPLESRGIGGFTHQSVYNWLEEKHNPSVRSLTTLISVSGRDSWQYQFASDLLKCVNSNKQQ